MLPNDGSEAASQRAIVLSDLHMGPASNLENFEDHETLGKFIEALSERSRLDARGFELVLAGDIFDFLQVPGYQGFLPDSAVGFLDAILRHPGVQRVMRALRHFAAGTGNSITVLSGNHDPELLIDAVRERLEGELGTDILWPDDGVLLAAEGDRWPIWGRALAHGSVWVAHGDRWDPINAVHRGAMRGAALMSQRAPLPTGSQLVLHVLNQLKPKYPWIDTLKPELAVLTLLWHLEPARVRGYLKQEYGIVGELLSGKLTAMLRNGPLFGVAMQPLGASELDVEWGHGLEPRGGGRDELFEKRYVGALAAAIRQATAEGGNSQRLIAEMVSSTPSSGAPGMLGGKDGALGAVVRSALLRLAASDAAVGEDTPDELMAAAIRRLPSGVQLLVLGHSHSARAPAPMKGIHYLNTGTWIPVGAIPPGSIEQRVVELGQGYAWPKQPPRTFAELDWGASAHGGLMASLSRFEPDSGQFETLRSLRLPGDG